MTQKRPRWRFTRRDKHATPNHRSKLLIQFYQCRTYRWVTTGIITALDSEWDKFDDHGNPLEGVTDYDRHLHSQLVKMRKIVERIHARIIAEGIRLADLDGRELTKEIEDTFDGRKA